MDERAYAYPPVWRLVGALAVAASRASLPALLLAVFLSHLPITNPAVVRAFAVLFMVPALAAWVIARAQTARVRVHDDELHVATAALALDVRLAVVGGVAPWRVPLPAAGFSLEHASGGRIRPGIASADPTPLLHALAVRDVPAAAAAARHPVVVYAHARAASGAWRWYHFLVRFPLFALVATAIFFNLDQHIVWGGLLGQYYILGLRPFLATFALDWATMTIYHVLYASIWRALAEAVCFVAAAVAPTRAARVRRAAELTIRVLYYGGVPALLALLFVPG